MSSIVPWDAPALMVTSEFRRRIIAKAEKQAEKLLQELEDSLNEDLAKGADILGFPIVKRHGADVYVLVDSGAQPIRIPHLTREPLSIKMEETPFVLETLRVVLKVTGRINLTGPGDWPFDGTVAVSALSVVLKTQSSSFHIKAGLGYDETRDEKSKQVLLELVSKDAGWWFTGYAAFARDDRFIFTLGMGRGPVNIPLGSTGFSLLGIEVTYGERFLPTTRTADRDKDPIDQLQTWEAKDIVRWARAVNNDPTDLWAPTRGHTRVAGLHTVIGDSASAGRVVAMTDAGITYISVGPILVLEGQLQLLETHLMTLIGAIDFGSGSFSVMNETKVEKYGLKLVGTGELSASLRGGAWFFALGGYELTGCTVSGFGEMFPKVTPAFAGGLRFSSKDTAFRAEVNLNWSGKWGAEVTFSGTAVIYARLARNPEQVEGTIYLEINASLRVKKWDVTIGLLATADLRHPRPKRALVKAYVRLRVTKWIKIKLGGTIIDYAEGDELGEPKANLRIRDDRGTQLELAIFHVPSGTTKSLIPQSAQGLAAIWPDDEIVIPFLHRARDLSGRVLEDLPFDGLYLLGSLQLEEVLSDVDIARELADGTYESVRDVRATWRDVPNVTAAFAQSVLHVPSNNPLGWISAYEYAGGNAETTPGETLLVHFGTGEERTLNSGEYLTYQSLRLCSPSGAKLTHGRSSQDRQSRLFSCRAASIEFGAVDANGQFVNRNVIGALIYLVCVTGQQSPPMIDAAFTADLKGAYAFDNDSDSDVLIFAIRRTDQTSFSGLSLRSTNGESLLGLLAVGYEQEAQSTAPVPPRTVLATGKYRLSVGSDTTASSKGFPSRKCSEYCSYYFHVVEPPLRPYILYSTAGDERLFSNRATGWYPTPLGVGFALYPAFEAVVRFRVPYMQQIYSQLLLERRQGSSKNARRLPPATIVPGAAVQPNNVADDWLDKRGALTPASEFNFDAGNKPGHYWLKISRPSSTGAPVLVDEWQYVISRFASPIAHLTPHKRGISRLFGPFGAAPSSELEAVRFGEEMIAERFLPEKLIGHLALSDDHVSLAFLQILDWCGVFEHQTLPPNADVLAPAIATELCVLLNRRSIPLGFLLRTPEPFDWRRIEGTATCSSSGKEIVAEVRCVPSPDGCASILLLSVGGALRYPGAGRYVLTLTYRLVVPSLPDLRWKAGVPPLNSLSYEFALG